MLNLRRMGLTALVLAGTALAQPATTSSNANLRAQPSTAAPILTVIPQGTVLDVTCSGAWCKVNTRAGYLAKSVLNLAQIQPLPAPARVQGDGYTNVDGVHVQSPVFTETAPAGASAKCRDGSYSFSLHRRGTCSHHGGVAEWL